MESQASHLFGVLKIAVTYLNDVSGLVPIPLFVKLGELHATEFGAVRAHYVAVGGCLLWTLEQGLGELWNDEVSDAWAWAYGVISTTMADAGDLALQKQEEAAASIPKDKTLQQIKEVK